MSGLNSYCWSCVEVLKTHRGLAGPDCQHIVIDEFLCMVSGCALETDACHWMFKTKVNMVQGHRRWAFKQTSDSMLPLPTQQ